MHHLPDNSVHLMITSPPYNVGKDYDDDLSLSEYRALLSDVLGETYRVLVEGGRACVNIANVGRTPYIPLHVDIMDIARECRLPDARRDYLGQGRQCGHVLRVGQLEVGEQPGLEGRPRVHPGLLQGCLQASGHGGEQCGPGRVPGVHQEHLAFPRRQRPEGQPPRPLPPGAAAPFDQPLLIQGTTWSWTRSWGRAPRPRPHYKPTDTTSATKSTPST